MVPNAHCNDGMCVDLKAFTKTDRALGCGSRRLFWPKGRRRLIDELNYAELELVGKWN